jgi:hypothetical protein
MSCSSEFFFLCFRHISRTAVSGVHDVAVLRHRPAATRTLAAAAVAVIRQLLIPEVVFLWRLLCQLQVHAVLADCVRCASHACRAHATHSSARNLTAIDVSCVRFDVYRGLYPLDPSTIVDLVRAVLLLPFVKRFIARDVMRGHPSSSCSAAVGAVLGLLMTGPVAPHPRLELVDLSDNGVCGAIVRALLLSALEREIRQLASARAA